MRNIYNIFRLNIKLLILNTTSLILLKQNDTSAKAGIKNLLMHVSMQKEYKKTKKINYKIYIIIGHLCLVNLF